MGHCTYALNHASYCKTNHQVSVFQFISSIEGSKYEWRSWTKYPWSTHFFLKNHYIPYLIFQTSFDHALKQLNHTRRVLFSKMSFTHLYAGITVLLYFLWFTGRHYQRFAPMFTTLEVKCNVGSYVMQVHSPPLPPPALYFGLPDCLSIFEYVPPSITIIQHP